MAAVGGGWVQPDLEHCARRVPHEVHLRLADRPARDLLVALVALPSPGTRSKHEKDQGEILSRRAVVLLDHIKGDGMPTRSGGRVHGGRTAGETAGRNGGIERTQTEEKDR